MASQVSPEVHIRRGTGVLLWVILILIMVDVAFVVGLSIRGRAASQTPEPDAVVSQAGKLFAMMKDYGNELQAVAGQANYPDNDAKEAIKKAVRSYTLNLELVRIAYTRLNERKDRESVIGFVTAACGVEPLTGECLTMQPPSFSHYDAGKYENGRYEPGKGTIKYANASRLESMSDDFVVLLTAMIKDVK